MSVIIQSYLFTILSTISVNQFRTTCWLTVNVLSSPKYKALVQSEIQALLDHSTALPTESISTKLSKVPLEIWESHTPHLDMCIRETIRVTLHGVAARQNVGDKSITIPSKSSPHGQGRLDQIVES